GEKRGKHRGHYSGINRTESFFGSGMPGEDFSVCTPEKGICTQCMEECIRNQGDGRRDRTAVVQRGNFFINMHKLPAKTKIRHGNLEISLVISGDLEYNNRECMKLYC
ncbi:MAG: hypothetical protein II979_02015, partial [Clostridia bacterium]|nr:hypothetical protein [Clostridia bacterium]